MFFNRNTKIIILTGITILTILFLSYKIKTDITYHAGKDHGYFKRLESVILLTVLFYVVISREKRILFGLIGFVVSIISSFIGAFITNSIPDFKFSDTIMHLVAFGISYVVFFGIEKLIKKKGSS